MEINLYQNNQARRVPISYVTGGQYSPEADYNTARCDSRRPGRGLPGRKTARWFFRPP